MIEDLVCVLVPRKSVPAEWLERAADVPLVRLLPDEAAELVQMKSAASYAPGLGRTENKSGWQSLTEAERRVAALVAAGLTNPEVGRRLYVSPRTVSTHLKHVFAKLGVTSRVELATLVARRGDGDP